MKLRLDDLQQVADDLLVEVVMDVDVDVDEVVAPVSPILTLQNGQP